MSILNIYYESTREDFEDIWCMEDIFLYKVTDIECKSVLCDIYRKDQRFFVDFRKYHITGKAVVYIVDVKNLHVCTCGEDMYLDIRPMEECWCSEGEIGFVGLWRCPHLRAWNTYAHDVRWCRVIIKKEKSLKVG